MELGLYQHYKGGYYHVIGLCRNEATLEEMVIYRHLDGDFGVWVRNKDIFIEEIAFDGKKMQRFKFVRSLDTAAPIVQPELV